MRLTAMQGWVSFRWALTALLAYGYVVEMRRRRRVEAELAELRIELAELRAAPDALADVVRDCASDRPLRVVPG